MRFYNGISTHIKICKIRIFVLFYKQKIKELLKKRKELKERINKFVKAYSKKIVAEFDHTELKRTKSLNSMLGIDTEEVFAALEETE